MSGVGGGQIRMPNQRDKYSKRGKWWLPPHTVHVVRHYCYSYKMYKDEYITLKDSIGVNAVNYDGMPSGNFRTGSSTENYAIRLAEVAKNIEIIEETVKEVCEQDKCSNIESNLLRYITDKEVAWNYQETVLGIKCGRYYFSDKVHHIYYEIAKKLKI